MENKTGIQTVRDYLTGFERGAAEDQRRRLTVDGVQIPITPGADVCLEVEMDDVQEQPVSILVNCTFEGIITDCFDADNEIVATSSIMYGERWESLQEFNIPDVDEVSEEAQEALDSMIHDLASNLASDTNNSGLDAQMKFICKEMGEKDGLRAIKECIEPD